MTQATPKTANVTRILASIAMIGVGVLGFGGSAFARPLRIALQPFLSYAPTFVALDKGYFRDEGLDVKTTMIRGGGTATFNETVSGAVDIGSGAITASLLNAVIKGTKLKVIAGKGEVRKGYSTNELWITRALYNSGVRTPLGLRGKTVATAGPGSSDWTMLGMMLAKYGLSLAKGDVLAAQLPGPERPLALENGTVAGAILVEPFIASVNRAKAVRLMRITDVVPVFQTAVFYTTAAFLHKHHNAVQKFLAALRKATAEYMKDPKSPEMLQILSKYTKVKISILKQATPAYFSLDGKVNAPAIRRQIAFLYANHLISRQVPLKDFISKGAM